MRIRIWRPLLALLVAWQSGLALAGEAVDPKVVEQLKSVLEVPSGGLTVESVETSEIPGLYAVQFSSGPTVYSTPDGSYFILGDLWTVGPQGYVNLAEKRRDGERLEKIAALDDKDMIIFAPEGEPKATLTVFTDVTCYYCQKLHKEVPELNKRGIEVRYLAYPRGGVDSAGYDQLVTAWCSDNRQDTLTRLKNKEQVKPVKCSPNPVAKEYELGLQLGVRGTPALVTEKGELIPGYQTADELMVTLGLQ